MITTGESALSGLVPNFDDAGGLRTADGAVLRSGRLMRSATLCAIPQYTADAVTATFGTGVYLDLRTAGEIDRDGTPETLRRRGWEWQHFPLGDKHAGDRGEEPDDFLRRYLVALPLYLRAARTALVAAAGSPVIVACALGKDRTGLVFALLLRWLGVGREDILENFAAVNARLHDVRRLLPPRWLDPGLVYTPVSRSMFARLLDELDARHLATSAPDDLPDVMSKVSRLLKIKGTR